MHVTFRLELDPALLAQYEYWRLRMKHRLWSCSGYLHHSLVILCLALGLIFVPAAQAADTVTVHIEGQIESVSRFTNGVTYTNETLRDMSDSTALSRAKTLLAQSVTYQNQHIMGWGAGNPEPAPGVYRFGSLDRRIELITSIPGAVPVITLCCAPDWMKGGKAGETDWDKLTTAPLPEHYDDFARLAAAIARRYPKVMYFQVWNEFKGFWDRSANNWDYRAYTTFYNQVYRAIKAVRPDAKVGGFYMVIEGTGSNANRSWASSTPITSRQEQALDYWLANKAGADFICLDKKVKDYHDDTTYTQDQLMSYTHFFGDVARQIRSKTDLPIWWSEYYLNGNLRDGSAVAAHTSVLAHMLRSGSSVALVWEEHHRKNALFDGEGYQLPAYEPTVWIQRYFAPGTPIYRSSSSDPFVEVLAGERKTLLINKDNAAKQVDVDGRSYSLRAYEVKLVDTPSMASHSLTIDDTVRGSGIAQFTYIGGGWQHCTDCEAAKFERSDSWNAIANESVTLAFRGTRISLYGARAPRHGIGAVSIDGGEQTRIDYYAATRADNVVLWTSPMLQAGPHTFTLRVSGAKNPASSGTVITVDRIAIVP